ncbi:hypothetical protein HN011_010737 [Eciton burchellii]|nr:hypothetical protein HN011_010737 [Eciton burchellii]
MKAYNTSVLGETEFTPHELVFGRTARFPTSNQLADDTYDKSYPKYATALFKRIFDAQATARENLSRTKIGSKRYYDRRMNPQEFKQCDYIYLIKEPWKSNFDEHYIGPYKILETLDNSNVRLEVYYVYLQTLSNSGCQRLHEIGTPFTGGSATISGAAPNSYMISNINLARSTIVDEQCSGTQYSDPVRGIKWLYKLPSESLVKTTRSRLTCNVGINTSFEPTLRQARRMLRFGKRANILVSNPPEQLPVGPISCPLRRYGN